MVELSWKVESYTINKHPIVHIQHICKLVTKQLEIKTNEKGTSSLKIKEYTKIEKISQK